MFCHHKGTITTMRNCSWLRPLNPKARKTSVQACTGTEVTQVLAVSEEATRDGDNAMDEGDEEDSDEEDDDDLLPF
jgi:hypothetical protein